MRRGLAVVHGWRRWLWPSVAVALAAIGQPSLWWVPADDALHLRHPDLLGAVVAVAVTVPVWLVRRAPLAGFAVSAGMLLAYDALGYPPTAVDLAPLILVVAVLATRPLAGGLVAAAVFEIGIGAVAALRPAGPGPGGLFGDLLVMAIPLGVGLALRAFVSRGRRERSAEVEQLRLAADRSAYEARLEFAERLHDTVGHGITLSILQAELASRALDDDPARSRQSLDDLVVRSRKAMDELHEMLDVLLGDHARSVGGRVAVADRPDGRIRFGDVIDLYGAAGLSVHADAEGLPPLPVGHESACARVVAEALANAARHGDAGAAWVTVAVDPVAGLVMEVEDDGAGPAPDWQPGFGLTRLAEYLEGLGGSVELRRSGTGGGALVRAVLPL